MGKVIVKLGKECNKVTELYADLFEEGYWYKVVSLTFSEVYCYARKSNNSGWIQVDSFGNIISRGGTHRTATKYSVQKLPRSTEVTII